MSTESSEYDLIRAVQDDACDEVMDLLAAGRNPDVADSQGYTALHWCCQLGFDNILDSLLSAGASVDRPDCEGFTPIMVAINSGNEEIARTLLDNGAHETQDRNGYTLLHAAAASGLREFADDLLSLPTTLKLVDSCDHAGRTPIHWATQENQVRLVELLLGKGADPNAVESDGFPALSIAASEGFTEIVETLIQHGAEVNPSDARCTELPLIVAAAWEREEVVRILLAHGADVNRSDDSGQTALFYARESGNERIRTLLLSEDG